LEWPFAARLQGERGLRLGSRRSDKRSAAKAQLAGLKKPSPSIDGKEHADKRSTAKAQLAGLKKPSPSSNPK
jgi:hypothetical protein